MKLKRKRSKLSPEEIKRILHVKTQEMECSRCGRIVKNVSSNSVKVVCYMCSLAYCKRWEDEQNEKKLKEKQDFPPGWKLRKVYIHSDGRVFHRGVEVPELKDKTNLKESSVLSYNNKENIILSVVENNGVLRAVSDDGTDYTEILNNIKKIKYAYSKNKKIIGKKINNAYTWRVI